MCYGNASWDVDIKNNLGRYTNWKHCIVIDLILKHNQKGSRLGRIR